MFWREAFKSSTDQTITNDTGIVEIFFFLVYFGAAKWPLPSHRYKAFLYGLLKAAAQNIKLEKEAAITFKTGNIINWTDIL